AINERIIADIALAAAEAMGSNERYTPDKLSCRSDGSPVSVWGDSADMRDALGWILKKSCDHEKIADIGVRQVRNAAYQVSELLNEQVIALTGRSLVTISSDDGREAVVKVLSQIAENIQAKYRTA
ncbi:MAG TPA: hypothetical protein PK109_02775, partial [Candidatus Paceibacterota bacterium]|nr:hypothetical protein [Candidatus Paceibacterota bacterium]